MKLQPTRKSIKGHFGRKGQTVYVDIGVWHDKATGEIHISAPREKKLHSTVSNDKKSQRYHSNLFRKLKEILEREGRW
jgi:hypothetical protein